VSLQVRELSPPCWPELAPLIAESEAEGLRFLARLRDDDLAGRVRFDGRGEVLLGVLDAGSLIAVGGLTREPYVNEATVGRLRHLYVRRSERRRGIGRLLVTALEARAKGAFVTLRLRTDSGGADAFYAALGYQRESESTTATHWKPTAR